MFLILAGLAPTVLLPLLLGAANAAPASDKRNADVALAAAAQRDINLRSVARFTIPESAAREEAFVVRKRRPEPVAQPYVNIDLTKRAPVPEDDGATNIAMHSYKKRWGGYGGCCGRKW